ADHDRTFGRPAQHQRQQRLGRHRDDLDDRHGPQVPARDAGDEQQVPHPARLDEAGPLMSSMFPTFDIASSALTTHRIWMNALADNIANINTVKPMSQAAYQEKFIVAQEIPSAPGQPVGVGGGVAPVKVEYGDATGMVTYDPTNPLADKNGLVRRP